ncbi:hypothetical protein LZ32DRAFT_657928 [Colletotrichum eremochloae]|nr:hypothetical protein LZ32DRAFT_657928 [Colletotrichum eremochloae]
MHLSAILPIFAVLVARASATPVADVEARAPNNNVELMERQTSSGCNYFAAPRCCVPAVCQCAGGDIYQINEANMNSGRHGCDPPWGYITDSNAHFPGYCCRTAEGQASEGITGDEALEYLVPNRFDLEG